MEDPFKISATLGSTGTLDQADLAKAHLWGCPMNPVHGPRIKTIDLDPSNRESHKRDDAEPGCSPISIHSFLEVENIRLRQAVVELSLDTLALREALKGVEAAS